MKTKYILVGGYITKAQDGGKGFYDELIKGFKEPVKILYCVFARPIKEWESVFKKDELFFKQNLPEKKFELVLAQPDNFIDQVKWADAIYIKGGETEALLNELKKQKGWEKELDNKTLAGTSAGADAIAKYYYDIDNLDDKGLIKKGLGLLPIKVITHYRSNYNAPNINWDEADTKLKNHKENQEDKENLEIIKLKEGEFKVFEK
jgi:peptidase E